MADQAKNVLIGLFVVSALLVVAFMLLFLNPTVGDDNKIYKIRFADVDKVNHGTRVTYAGKPVGEVTDVRIVQDPDHPREALDGHIYLYEVTIVVDSSVDVFQSDEITLRTSGLLGERSVAITPKPVRVGTPLTLVGNEIIFATENASLEETLKEFKELSDKFEQTLDSILFTIREINNEKIVAKISRTAQNLVEITDVINNKEALNGIIANFQSFSSDLARGEGTFGNLIRKDDLYLRTNSLLSKAEVALDDINHYGLFYSSDKNWQRVRARRANLLYTLTSPAEFKNYFNDEVDQITTSLDRVNVVLQETADNCGCFDDNAEYKKVFAELLRRVKQMEESVRLYNTQLMSPDTFKTELCN